MSCFLSLPGDLSDLIRSFFKRIYDRGFKIQVKKDTEDEDDDEVNSKCKTQEELEEIYTGEQFEGA